MEDAKIVELFLNRSEMAIQETKSKYHGYLHHLVYNILYDSCDTEEIVDDTYMGAWNSIPPTIPENLKYFLSRARGRAWRGSGRQRSWVSCSTAFWVPWIGKPVQCFWGATIIFTPRKNWQGSMDSQSGRSSIFLLRRGAC